MAPSGCLWRGAATCRDMPASQTSLTHGRDHAQGTGQPAERPEAPAEQELAFARTQLSTIPRTGRFSPAETTPTTHPPSIGRRRPQRSVTDRPRELVPFGVRLSGAQRIPALTSSMAAMIPGVSQPEIQRQVRQQRADIDALYELVERVDQKVDAVDVKLDRRFDEISGQLSEVLRQLGGR